MTGNPLQQIPAKVRRWLYTAYGLAGLGVAVAAVYDVDGTDKAAAALVVVGTAFGFTAASNVAAGPVPEHRAED